jgi:2-methylcitrate dehydratase PrpD
MNDVSNTPGRAANAANRADLGQGFTAHVVAEASTIRAGDLNAQQRERTFHAILDWLGVTIAGAWQPSAQATHRVMLAEGAAGVARITGTGHRVAARQAALAGGIAGHAMDFDDMGIGGHPSVCVLPAVFAVAEELDASGAATIEAILQGYEAMNMVAAACGKTTYRRGFHNTGVFGAFGATMGVGRLLGLDALHLQRAFGIAAAQASGLKANFGTMSKHLNAGNAAAVGVLAARLAQAGFTGATNALEAPEGLAASHNDSIEDFEPNAPGTSRQARLAVEQIMFKPHAACGGTHSAINSIRAILERRPFKVEEVDDVELVVAHDLMPVCGIAEPTTAVEGMFSVRYAATLALTGSDTGPSGFTDAKVNDPALRAVRKLVRVVPDARIASIGSPAEVTVRLKTGEALTESLDALIVTPDDQLGQQRRVLEAKFHGLVAPVLGERRSEELAGMAAELGGMKSIREFSELTAPAN